jgi:imidazolonepropionase-like amidohydrolase
VAARAAGLDLGSPEVTRFVRLLAERKIEVDPTLAIFEGMLTGRPGEVSPGFRTVADRFPAQARRGFLGGGLQPPEGMDETYRESYRRMVEMVGKLYQAGVPLLAGTDFVAGDPAEEISDIRKVELTIKGGTLYRSAELYQALGIRP